ncbi:dehydrogenase [Vallitalea longa]|uniref:Dehydrogenase n=1 Tax=Vallitalea longa TaxID=2936439 RepID=A0A9W5Y7B2_9FIRM|nr:Gfo/Idh/MocA family oxidoreductase [Vallitalea longa]GKX27582.1 dehydrogenase [Vallitalea longa]
MKKLRIGIIGCGRISVVYKEVFKKCSDQIEVAFAVDKVLDRAKTFATDFEDCSYSDKLEDLLEEKLDIVHICTPHFLHKEQILQCLDKGINVLTEKPLAITMEDADIIIDAANKSDKKFGVIFQNRYIEGVVKAKQLIDSGEMGKVLGAWSSLTWWRPPSYYECDWKGSWEKEGGGVLIDQAIHSIDLVQYLVGSKVEWIQGQIDNRVLKSVEVEDVASAAIGFESGCIYSLFATNYYTKSAPIQIEIMCEKGIINIKGFDVTIEKDGETSTIKHNDKIEFEGKGYWGIYHYHQIKEFYDNVIKDTPVKVTGCEGRKALEIVLGVYKSAKESQKIEVNK